MLTLSYSFHYLLLFGVITQRVPCTAQNSYFRNTIHDQKTNFLGRPFADAPCSFSLGHHSHSGVERF